MATTTKRNITSEDSRKFTEILAERRRGIHLRHQVLLKTCPTMEPRNIAVFQRNNNVSLYKQQASKGLFVEVVVLLMK
eukprot:gene3106-3574_t